MFTLEDVVIFGLIIGAAGLWWNEMGAKAHALVKVKRYCDDENLQLLDQSIMTKGLWLHKNKRGGLNVKRTFEFEFTSTGEHRYWGKIVLVGLKVLSIEASPYHLN